MHAMKKRAKQLAAVWLAAAVAFGSTGPVFPVSAQEISAGKTARYTASGSEASRSDAAEKENGGQEQESGEINGVQLMDEDSGTARTASSSETGREEMFVSWDLAGTGGTVTNEAGETVTQLQGEKGSFANEAGDILKIDASSGKFAPDAENLRTQVNGGTKLSVPAEGDLCILTVTAYNGWGGAEEEALNAASFAGANAVSLLSMEPSEEDGSYRDYQYRCVLEENADQLTLTVEASGSMYLKGISAEYRQMDSVRVYGGIMLDGVDALPEDIQIEAENMDTGEQYSGSIKNSGTGYTYEITVKLEDEANFRLDVSDENYRILEGAEFITGPEDTEYESDITVGSNEKFPVTVEWAEEASELLGELEAGLTYTYIDERGEETSFQAGEEIALPGGTYTLRVEGLDPIPYQLSGSLQIFVAGEVTQTLRLKEITSWYFYPKDGEESFAGEIQGETGYFRGLRVDAAMGKLSAHGDSAQFNAGTIIHVPVNGSCQVTVEAHSGIYALYTIDGQAADTTQAATSVSCSGEGDEVIIESTGDAYIKSISVVYPGSFEPDHPQEVMPSIAELGSAGSLNVDADGWTLTFTQTGGIMEGGDSLSDTVSYFLFPETEEAQILEADVQVVSGGTSNTSGVFFGAFDGKYAASAGIRSLDNLRGIYSKEGTEGPEAAGAGGINADIQAGTKISFRGEKTEDGYQISASDGNGLDVSQNLSYDDALLFADGENTSCRYGFAFADVTVQVTNLKLTAEDGTVLYDQTACYDPSGYPPSASSVSAEADATRQFIHVSWIGDACEGDGRYWLQVSYDGSTYIDVADDLMENAYDFPVENAGNHWFRVCGILGADKENCTEYTEVGPVYILPALPTPVLTLSGTETAVTLNWTASAGADRYEIWRYSFDQTAEGAVKIGGTDGSVLTYTDTQVVQQMPYYYYVIGYGQSEGEPNWSNPSETVWTVLTGPRKGEYAYEDQAVPVSITEKTPDTTRSRVAVISGTVGEACSLQVEVNGVPQTEDIALEAGGTFTVNLTLAEGRNDVNLYFTDKQNRVTRKTFNYVLLTNYDMVVDGNWAGADGALEDGIPVYRTVQAAVDAVPADNSSRKVILIREGSYREHLRVDKPMISLIGEDQEKVRIHFYDAEESPEGGDMALRCAVYVTEAAAGFSAENLTFENDYEYTGAGGNESADALRNDASETVYVNVAIRGFQDTLCANRGEQYYYKCRILGNVDFIYGNEPRAFFEDCDLIFRYSSTKNSGYVAAPRTAAEAEYGLTFYNCRILSEDGCSGDKYLLARPWGVDACIAFLDCYMGSIINAEAPYDDMSGNSFMAARFFEYGTYGPGFAINPSRRQISPARADAMLQPELLGWDPYDAMSLLGQDYMGDLGIEDPMIPEEPVDPEDPTEPVDPEDPENPTDPTDPENPSEPTGPEEPGQPENPEEPSDPGTSEGNEPPGNSGNGSSGGGSSSGGSSSGGGSSRTDSRSQLAQYYIEVRQAQEVRADAVLVLPTAQGDWAQAADTTWRFVKTDGTLAKNEWQLVNNFWYHFDGNGLMQNGWIQTPDGRWYYLDLQSGAMKTGWNLINGKWYYLDAVNGHCLINTITPDGYRVDSTGAAIL